MEDTSDTTSTTNTVTADTNKRPREEELGESPKTAKRLHADILFDILDDENSGNNTVDPTGDLATVMRSLEEEIGLPSPPYGSADDQDAALFTDPVSADSASGVGRQPELGFLFEASDDELGLPPTVPTSSEEGDTAEEEREIPSGEGFGQIWGFEDDIPSGYDAFDFGFDGEDDKASAAPAAVTTEQEGVLFHGGLFDDYSDVVVSSQGDMSEYPWRPESLPAV